LVLTTDNRDKDLANEKKIQIYSENKRMNINISLHTFRHEFLL